MSLNEAFHFLFGGAAATQYIFELGGVGTDAFTTNDAEHLHIHGFVLTDTGGAASVVTFADADGVKFYSCTVPANGSTLYNGAPFYIDNGIAITVASAGAPNIKWSVAYCGELIER